MYMCVNTHIADPAEIRAGHQSCLNPQAKKKRRTISSDFLQQMLENPQMTHYSYAIMF